MGLDWLGRPQAETDVSRFVSRKQYGRAIEALRHGFARKLPDASQRLQLAALLVLARRGEEAVALLLGLADENVRNGRPERALELLRRVEAIEPGRPEVAARRSSLQLGPVVLGSLDDPGLPEDEPVLGDPDSSDTSAWARAVVDAAFGPVGSQ